MSYFAKFKIVIAYFLLFASLNYSSAICFAHFSLSTSSRQLSQQVPCSVFFCNFIPTCFGSIYLSRAKGIHIFSYFAVVNLTLMYKLIFILVCYSLSFKYTRFFYNRVFSFFSSRDLLSQGLSSWSGAILATKSARRARRFYYMCVHTALRVYRIIYHLPITKRGAQLEVSEFSVF